MNLKLTLSTLMLAQALLLPHSMAAPVQSTAAPARSEDDEALAAAALEGLLAAPPERALPLLQRVLEGDRSPKLKKRALFVLSQIDAPGALDSVIAIAGQTQHPLQAQAIEMIGISGEAKALAALDTIYAKAADSEIKRRVLDAWLVADAGERIVEAAQNESDPKLRRKAIELLGAMGARDALHKLYGTSTDAATRRTIVDAYGVAGDIPHLREIAASDADSEVREAALHALGVAGAGEDLVTLYASANSEELREAALQGLMISGNSQGLLQLYRDAKSADEKKAVLRVLVHMDDDAALEAIEAALQR